MLVAIDDAKFPPYELFKLHLVKVVKSCDSAPEGIVPIWTSAEGIWTKEIVLAFLSFEGRLLS